MTAQRVIEAYEDAIRGIALATVQCRSEVTGFHVPQNAARELLVECERHLSALIALGAVPPPVDPRGLPRPNR